MLHRFSQNTNILISMGGCLPVLRHSVQVSTDAGPSMSGFVHATRRYSSRTNSVMSPKTCDSCGTKFTLIFSRKIQCSDCRGYYCSQCMTANSKVKLCVSCATMFTSLQLDHSELMKLKVKDLKGFLERRGVPNQTCCEKKELVELVLRHAANSNDPAFARGPARQAAPRRPAPRPSPPANEGNVSRASTEFHTPTNSEPRDFSPGAFRTPSPFECGRASSDAVLGEDPLVADNRNSRSMPNVVVSSDSEEHLEAPPQVTATSQDPVSGADNSVPSSPQELKKEKISVNTVTFEEIDSLRPHQLKAILQRSFVAYHDCREKGELVDRVKQLWTDHHKNSEKVTAETDQDNVCKICMDAAIDCVLLECGHMVTCTACGKLMSECPICRQYVVRVVHIFRA